MDRIDQAVKTCLAHAAYNDRPFIQVSKFIDELMADKTWTEREIMDVQMKVIRALIHELRRAEDTGEDRNPKKAAN